MSLIQRIVTRRVEDIINQGSRLAMTGLVSGDTTVLYGNAERTVVVTGFVLTSNSGTPRTVTLGFNDGSTTTVFFEGYISSTSPVSVTYAMGDERYSGIGDSLVIATTGGIAYTINGRLVAEKVALGYIEHLGAPAHQSPRFPDESGASRGQMEI